MNLDALKAYGSWTHCKDLIVKAVREGAPREELEILLSAEEHARAEFATLLNETKEEAA